jgi:hypothetical protein
MRLLVCCVTVAAMSSHACTASHSVAVINRSDVDMKWTQLKVGQEQAGLGWIAPGSQKVFIFSGRLGKEAVLEWEAPEKHHANVDLSDVPRDFAGTILLEVMKDGTVKKSIEEPIPGLRK